MKTTTQPQTPSRSPWGDPDSITGRAPGIFEISTPSHGGFFLALPQWEHLQKLFPGFQPYAGPQWLEEDCDAVLVPLAFPAAFDDEGIFFAVVMARAMATSLPRFKTVCAYLDTPEAAPLLQRSAAYHAQNPNALKRFDS